MIPGSIRDPGKPLTLSMPLSRRLVAALPGGREIEHRIGVRFSYSYNGREYLRRADVCWPLAIEIAPGMPVTVIVNPDHPGTCLLEEDRRLNRRA
jgi:hypothetical protein